MAAATNTLHCHAFFIHRKINSFPTKLGSRYSTLNQNLAHAIPCVRNSNSAYSVRLVSVSKAFKKNRGDPGDERNGILHIFMRWMEFIPGGSWWDLSDFEQKVDVSPTVAKPMTVWKALSQMWALVADEKWILYAAFGALTVAALSEISMPGILTATVFLAQNGDTSVFFQNSCLLTVLCFTSGICSGLRNGCFAIANIILVKRLRETLYSSLLLQDMSFFDTEAVGDLTSRIGTDCQQLSHTIGHDIHLILRNIIQGAGAFVNLTTLSWPLTLSSLVICFTLSAIFVVYGQYQKKTALLAQNFVASANEVAQETFSMMRTVRAYGTEREEFQRFTRWLDRLASVGMRESLANGLWSFSFHTFYRLTQVFAVLLGGMSILAGHVSAEELTKNKVPILKNVSFSVQVDEVVAIVGVNGSGKSTLINLMLGLYEPSCGEILIGGIPLKQMDIRWLRENIGYVEQEPHLFHMDVKSNITYGCSGSIEQENIEFAAKNAHAHEFISALPSGYNTIIDDNLLSGGQKQRIAIARAILRDPIILVLDEATSALDTESEGYIEEIFYSLKKGPERWRTVIVIAHRLSTVKAADKILVMNDGQLVEIGNHGELLRKGGLYAQLFNLQTDALPPSIKHQEEGLVE